MVFKINHSTVVGHSKSKLLDQLSYGHVVKYPASVAALRKSFGHAYQSVRMLFMISIICCVTNLTLLMQSFQVKVYF